MAEAEVPTTVRAAAQPSRLSCLTIPSFSDACRFIKSRYSCLVVKTHRRHLALAPKYLHKKRSGIKEYLDAELLKYNVVLEGVPLAYDNIKIVGELGDIYDDIGYIHINIEADFVIFQPQCGKTLEGVVNKKAPSHIGCLVHGCFNASIPRPARIPVEVWQCMKANIGDQLTFEVFRLDSDSMGVFCIRGRLNKKMEAEIANTMPMEENGNVPHHNEQNASEIAEEQPVGDTSILSGAPSKKVAKKRLYRETLSQNEDAENQEHTILEESPKKKRKKHKLKEVLSQNESEEVDGAGDHSAINDSLQSTDVIVDSSVVEVLSSSSQEHRAKKSKKKKRKDHHNLESSLHNGLTEDSFITDDCTLEGLETEQEITKKKRKKKHKNTHMSEETLEDAAIIQQETPRMKKHKKKH